MVYVLFLKIRGPTLTKILRNVVFHIEPEKGTLLKAFINMYLTCGQNFIEFRARVLGVCVFIEASCSIYTTSK